MLQLREITDAYLLEAGLEGLYIGHSNNKYTKSQEVAVCGPCGDPLMFIPGVNLPNKMNKAEREYAAKLIKKFVDDKGDDIDTIWTIKKNKIDLKNFHEDYSFDIYNKRDTLTLRPKKLEINTFNINCNMFTKHITYDMFNLSASEITTVIARTKIYVDIIENYIKEYKKDVEQMKTVSLLTTCIL